VKWSAVYPVLRDVGIWAAALFGIIFQQVTGKVNAELLGAYLAMLGIPAVIGVVHLVRGKADDPATPTPPSPSPSDSSSALPSSPSS